MPHIQLRHGKANETLKTKQKLPTGFVRRNSSEAKLRIAKKNECPYRPATAVFEFLSISMRAQSDDEKTRFRDR